MFIVEYQRNRAKARAKSSYPCDGEPTLFTAPTQADPA